MIVDLQNIGAFIVGAISADDDAEFEPDVGAILRSKFEEWMASDEGTALCGMSKRDFLLVVEAFMRSGHGDAPWILPRAEWEADPEKAISGIGRD